jgi:hypothetical protein
MHPSHYQLEFFANEQRRARLQEAEYLRRIEPAARRQQSWTMWQNLKPGLVSLLIKVGWLTALLTVMAFVINQA